eukprot:11192865-Lingulodinium_polyedra.AAC.1
MLQCGTELMYVKARFQRGEFDVQMRACDGARAFPNLSFRVASGCTGHISAGAAGRRVAVPS